MEAGITCPRRMPPRSYLMSWPSLGSYFSGGRSGLGARDTARPPARLGVGCVPLQSACADDAQQRSSDVFSPWALHPSLDPIKLGIGLGAVLLALLVAFIPGRRSLPQVAALAGACHDRSAAPGDPLAATWGGVVRAGEDPIAPAGAGRWPRAGSRLSSAARPPCAAATEPPSPATASPKLQSAAWLGRATAPSGIRRAAG
jgi:hypothetical protein